MFYRELLKEKPGTHLVSQEEAAKNSNTIIIAINSDHYSKLPTKLLENKVLVDVANVTKVKDPK